MNTAGGGSDCKGWTKVEAKCASSNKLEMLMAQCKCVFACTHYEEEGPLGQCPFAVILIQLFSCSSFASHTLFVARPEYGINNAPPRTPSGCSPFLFLSLPLPLTCCFGSNSVLLRITWQKGTTETTNEQEIN